MLQLNWEFEALHSSFSFPASSSNELFSLLFFGLTKMPGSYSLAKMTYKTKCSCKAESRGVKRRKVPITSGPPAVGACTVPHTTDCEKVLQQKAQRKSLSHVQLFATPQTIWSMEFSRQEYWSGQPFPSPGGLPNPRFDPRSPPLQADFFLPAEVSGKPNKGLGGSQILLEGREAVAMRIHIFLVTILEFSHITTLLKIYIKNNKNNTRPPIYSFSSKYAHSSS